MSFPWLNLKLLFPLQTLYIMGESVLILYHGRISTNLYWKQFVIPLFLRTQCFNFSSLLPSHIPGQGFLQDTLRHTFFGSQTGGQFLPFPQPNSLRLRTVQNHLLIPCLLLYCGKRTYILVDCVSLVIQEVSIPQGRKLRLRLGGRSQEKQVIIS